MKAILILFILILFFLSGCHSKQQISLKGQENVVLTGNVTITPISNHGCLNGYSWNDSEEKCLKS